MESAWKVHGKCTEREAEAYVLACKVAIRIGNTSSQVIQPASSVLAVLALMLSLMALMRETVALQNVLFFPIVSYIFHQS